jgi:hypothetical protein
MALLKAEKLHTLKGIKELVNKTGTKKFRRQIDSFYCSGIQPGVRKDILAGRTIKEKNINKIFVI